METASVATVEETDPDVSIRKVETTRPPEPIEGSIDHARPVDADKRQRGGFEARREAGIDNQ